MKLCRVVGLVSIGWLVACGGQQGSTSPSRAGGRGSGAALEAAVAGAWSEGLFRLTLFGEGDGREFQLDAPAINNNGGGWRVVDDDVVLTFAQPEIDDAEGLCFHFDRITASELRGGWQAWTAAGGCAGDRHAIKLHRVDLE